jgi:type I restriction enzyme S subunit
MPFEQCLLPAEANYQKLKQKELLRSGLIPVIDQGEEFIAGYTDKASNKYPGSLPVVLFGDHTRRVKYVDFEFAVGADGIKLLHPFPALHPRFFYYYLNALKLESQGYSRHFRFLREIDIPIPPLNEQRRIVAKLEKLLSRVDAAQARLATIPRILKQFRQSVIAAACSGRLTADWRKQNLDVEVGTELIERIRRTIMERYERECALAKQHGSRRPKPPNILLDLQPDPLELPELPLTWSWSYLQNLGEFTRGKSKHRPRNDPKLFGGEYPFIQTGDVSRSNGRILSHSQTYSSVGLAQSRLFPTGTLCITIAANIAETAILTYPACFPDSVVGFIPEEGLFEALWAMYFVRVVQNNLETFAPATAQKNINMDILFRVAVPVPPLAEQQEIVRGVETLFKTADALEARYRTAKAHVDTLTQSILAKAFRGELVPQNPNDEPASVLLERIRQSKDDGDKKRTRGA